MIPFTEEDLKFKWTLLSKERNVRTTKRSCKHRKKANFLLWNNFQKENLLSLSTLDALPCEGMNVNSCFVGRFPYVNEDLVHRTIYRSLLACYMRAVF